MDFYKESYEIFLEDIRGIIKGGIESENDFKKRMLYYQMSAGKLIAELQKHIQIEDYETCALIRDVMVKRGITLKFI